MIDKEMFLKFRNDSYHFFFFFFYFYLIFYRARQTQGTLFPRPDVGKQKIPGSVFLFLQHVGGLTKTTPVYVL